MTTERARIEVLIEQVEHAALRKQVAERAYQEAKAQLATALDALEATNEATK